jgi:Holliday junction resolvasome RuvABC endonuclease subunit
VGRIDDPAFRYGTQKLPSTGPLIGRFAVAFNAWLCEMIQSNKVTMVVMEAPILPKKTSLAVTRKLHGLAWHSEYVCEAYHIPCEEIDNSTIKKFMSGDGWAKKADMVNAARLMGYDVKTDDEADAIGCRLAYMAMKVPALMRGFNTDLGPLGVAAAKKALATA